MKVHELINKLSEYPQDTNVYIRVIGSDSKEKAELIVNVEPIKLEFNNGLIGSEGTGLLILS